MMTRRFHAALLLIILTYTSIAVNCNAHPVIAMRDLEILNAFPVNGIVLTGRDKPLHNVILEEAVPGQCPNII